MNRDRIFLLAIGFLDAILMLLSLLLKVLQWKNMESINFLAFGIMAYSLAPMIFYMAKSKNSPDRLSFEWYGYAVSFFLFGNGMIFKMFHYPTANIQQIIGGLILILFCLPLTFWTLYKKEKQKVYASN